MLIDWTEHIAANGDVPACGWPEWVMGSGATLRLVCVVGQWYALYPDTGGHCVSRYEALVLFRDHAREQCAAHDIFIEVPFSGNHVVVRLYAFASGDKGYLKPGGYWSPYLVDAEAFSDYDRALIAACVAASKEEPSDAEST
jgi:hypothetical protein